MDTSTTWAMVTSPVRRHAKIAAALLNAADLWDEAQAGR